MSTSIWVITGASRGIGLATAERAARRGAGVVLAARGADRLEQAAARIRALGAACEAVAADVSTRSGAESLIERAVQRFGRIDVLVNNAGTASLRPVDQTSDQDFDASIGANVASVFYLTRRVWPVMRQQRSGVIVNISSIAAFDPFPGFSVYGACKAWVNTFTLATAAEGKPLGIRVFAVAPGAVETQMLRSAFPDLPAEQTLAPDDVAAAIEGLCDERFAHSVGQTIVVRR